METWFVQHWPNPKDWSERKNRKIQQELFDRREIGVHYQDKSSHNPLHYKKKFRPYIQKLNDIAKEGGYVCANYPALKRALIGKIKPGSAIVGDSRSPWLKRIRLIRTSELPAIQRAMLLVGAPRRATISRWKIIGSRLGDLVNRRKCKDWGFLQPSEQETICQEYLRVKHGLVYLLVPFGRSLEDLDVIGIDRNGNPIVAQVTFTDSISNLENKARILNGYKGSLFFFSPNSDHLPMLKKKYPRVRFVPTENVWQWLKTKPAYAKAILG